MKIGIRDGHSPNCKGAIALRDEQACMRILCREVIEVLEKHGHEVVYCGSNARTENGELSEGINKANSNNVDIFISLHMDVSKEHKANGTCSFVAKEARKSIRDIAQRLVDNFETLGLQNRGVRESNYREMREVNAPNIIFETMFCDNLHDINEVWSPTPYEKMALLIANAIDPTIKENELYRVVVQYFNSKEDAENCQQEIAKRWYCFVEGCN
ncbi:N-acetylmuramoyl-L-alanine amidase [Clostridium phage CPS1]|uniref:N-acetylmuramoyl-L-alanine amidase n=1 Tax=Clostridium phage CPS1 TaxID=1983541 RepID=A0A2D0WXW5_9CAUD|nr:endolysin [Clostridium phage CPS1]ARW58305.1 N-acetylmuramoyl-L-alanine amidase [Clostridium phage CPS1]